MHLRGLKHVDSTKHCWGLGLPGRDRLQWVSFPPEMLQGLDLSSLGRRGLAK
jgi:hypothetical protein